MLLMTSTNIYLAICKIIKLENRVLKVVLQMGEMLRR
jgi:hypothetical protein